MRRLLRKRVNFFGKEVSVLMIMLVSVIAFGVAALIPYFGQITGSAIVTQGLSVDSSDWDAVIEDYDVDFTSLEEKTLGSEHTLKNDANVDVVLDFETNVSGESADEVVTNVEYLLSAEGVQGTEERVFVIAQEAGVDVLGDINTIDWESFVEDGGYIAHVDVLIDTDGDGVKDDALVFEYDKVALPSDVSPLTDSNYQTDAWTDSAFDDKGLVDDNARAWLSSGAPGALNSPGFIDGLLSDWKTGNADDSTIDGNTKVVGFEIEVDNWVLDTEAKIRNIKINGNDVKVTLRAGEELDFAVVSDFPKMLKPDTYEVTTIVKTA